MAEPPGGRLMAMTFRVAWFVLAAALAAAVVTDAGQSRGPLDLATAPVSPGARRISYGSDPLQFGELRGCCR